MNFGTFPGPGNGTVAGAITRYIQTPVITTSQTIAVPPGTQRIEALLVGGGGGGVRQDNSPIGGGGFGGAAVIEIPITGSPLQIVIGAGGSEGTTSTNTAGSPTYVVSAGTRYAEVGGGGAGMYQNYADTPTFKGHGRSGGGGGGNSGGSSAEANNAGSGGPPPIGNILWTPYPQIASYISTDSNVAIGPVTAGSGTGGTGLKYTGGNGSFGGGGGGGTSNGIAAYGGGGAGTSSSYPGVYGGGSGPGVDGGSLTAVTIWGFTGRAGGTGASQGGGGGGGLFGAGGNATAGTIAGNGGLGGGGGGAFETSAGVGTAGNGGSGAAVIRFYL